MTPEGVGEVFRDAMFHRRPIKMKMSKWKPAPVDGDLLDATTRFVSQTAVIRGAECVSTGMGISGFMSPESRDRTVIGSRIAMVADVDDNLGRTVAEIWAAEPKVVLGMTVGSTVIGQQFSHFAALVTGRDPKAVVEFR